MPDLTVRAVEVTDATRRHPLATQAGLTIFVQYLAADVAWSGCTTPQRRLITALCEPLIPTLVQQHCLLNADLPHLPTGTRPTTIAALIRRGLADDTPRLTADAVHAYYWQIWWPAHRSPPIVDVHLPDPPEETS